MDIGRNMSLAPPTKIYALVLKSLSSALWLFYPVGLKSRHRSKDEVKHLFA